MTLRYSTPNGKAGLTAFPALARAQAIPYLWNLGATPADLKDPFSQSVENLSRGRETLNVVGDHVKPDVVPQHRQCPLLAICRLVRLTIFGHLHGEKNRCRIATT